MHIALEFVENEEIFHIFIFPYPLPFKYCG